MSVAGNQPHTALESGTSLALQEVVATLAVQQSGCSLIIGLHQPLSVDVEVRPGGRQLPSRATENMDEGLNLRLTVTTSIC